jgi:hypothetical protein
VGEPAFRRPGAQLHVSLQNLPYRGTVALGNVTWVTCLKGIVQAHCHAKLVELQRLQATLTHNTPSVSKVMALNELLDSESTTVVVPATNGRSAVSAAISRLICLSHAIPRNLKVSV